MSFKTRIVSVFITFLFSIAANGAQTVSEDLISYLYTLKGEFRTLYAPMDWKKTFAGYDLETEFNKALLQAQSNPNLTQKEAQRILIDFVYATRDYHTSIGFHSTESAALPLTIKGAAGRYFIAHIDRNKLSMSSFPFAVGDEVAHFDGRATDIAVQTLKKDIVINVDGTDQAIAELNLTRRRASRGQNVLQGPVTLGIIPKGDSAVKFVQLVWEYLPERVNPRGTLMVPMSSSSGRIGSPSKSPMMMVNLGKEMTAPSDNPFTIGGRKSFIPDLGPKIWESAPESTFHAYIYLTPERKLVGYVRIAGYIEADYKKALKDFAEIIARFQTTTDSMIIDQVNNPGGSVFYLYSLASMLTDQPLVTPRHRMAISQADVVSALAAIPTYEAIHNDDDAATKIPAADLDGFVPSYEFARFSLNYLRFIVDQWNSGIRLTKAFWIGGADHINPHPTHYTKPILVLINQLDFSGGDFFPTILQDNKRVTILGSRTAGAGGYVMETKVSNNLGVEYVSMTGSIAERVSGNPIENLGVTPDLPYELTPQDYQENFAPYVKTIKAALKTITP